MKAAYPDGPISKDYTSIVNDQQYSMLVDLIDDSRAHGARIIEVGHRPGDATRRPHTLAPTVVLGVTDEKITHQEIFGPILPIFGYGNIDDAITYVNARPRPLALYYFGDDDADRREVLDRTTSGNVTSMARSCTSRKTICPSVGSVQAALGIDPSKYAA